MCKKQGAENLSNTRLWDSWFLLKACYLGFVILGGEWMHRKKKPEWCKVNCYNYWWCLNNTQIHVLHHSQWEVSKFVTSLFTLRSESCAFSLVKIMFVFMCLWVNFHLLFVCSGLVMEGYLFKKSSNAFRSWHRWVCGSSELGVNLDWNILQVRSLTLRSCSGSEYFLMGYWLTLK